MNKDFSRVCVPCLVSVLVLGVVCLWSNCTTRGASTIIVPDDYFTIQEAINNAIDGDTIFVKTGIYYEHVVVNRTLFLTGENSSTTMVDGSWTGTVINVTQDGVVISGLTVRRSGSISWGNAGIIIDNVQDCRVETNMITENPFAGVYLYNSSECAVIENQITGNSGVGVTTNYGGGFHDISMNNITGNGFSAITLNEEDSNTIHENNLTSNNQAVSGHCINLYRSSNNTIVGNNIEDDDNGIRMEYWSNSNRVLENSITQITTAGTIMRIYSDNNTIVGNTIADGRFGVVVNGSRYTDIYGNTIAHNHGSEEWDAGVRLDSAGYSQVRDNEIADNSRGIVVYASSPNVTICGNNVTSNDYGIRVAMGGSNYANISGNYVADNRGYGIDVTGFGGGGGSNYATIAGNLIVNNTFEAVGLGIGSSYNTVTQNSMIGNGHAGVTLERYSNYNTVVQNNIIGNAYGICFDLYTVNSTQNTIFNNNIINNTQQVRIAPGSINAWNSSYALGGNYWSNYNGSDCRNGPSQNLAGCDGIGDTANVIDGNNRDNYPIMKPIPWDSYAIGVTCLGKVGVQGASSMKTVIAEGTSVHFSVFVMNYGNDAETFNVTTYIDATLLGTQTGITIPSRGYAIVNFTWDTDLFEKGSYAISAQITAVPDETDTGDNSLVCTAAVGLVGDVDNNGIVNMLDVYNIALHYGALVGQTNYVPNYDTDDNNVINMLDLYIAAMHFGHT